MNAFSTTVTVNSDASIVWAFLTNPDLMVQWMGDPELKIQVDTDWKENAPIIIRGFHHVSFENKGIVLKYERNKRLRYSHFSSISRLSDKHENYSILEFNLTPVGEGIQLSLNVRNFPTESIRKHLEFYWTSTMIVLKKVIESYSGLKLKR